MSRQILPDARTLPREPWLAPWVAVREYQNQVAHLWLNALSGWSVLFPASAQTEEAASILPQDERAAEPAQPAVQPENATTSQPETLEQAQQKRRPHAGKTARTHTLRQPARNKKGAERTRRGAPAVLKGLRSRSHSAKLAAVSAMIANKRLRTKEAIPLLQRIMDNQTIRRRSPELRKAARTVLQQAGRRP